jgi:hypothetical protein
MKNAFYVLVSLFFSANIYAFEAEQQNEQLKAAVSVHSHEIKACYKNNLSQMKNAQGKIVVDFEVNDQGVLIKSDINNKKTTLKNKILTECILGKFKTWIFPAAAKGTTTSVSYPFIFRN